MTVNVRPQGDGGLLDHLWIGRLGLRGRRIGLRAGLLSLVVGVVGHRRLHDDFLDDLPANV